MGEAGQPPAHRVTGLRRQSVVARLESVETEEAERRKERERSRRKQRVPIQLRF